MRTPTRNRILVAALILAVAVLAGLLRPRDANAEGYTFYAMENLDAGDIVVRNIGTAYGVEKSTTSADTSVVGVVKYDTLATEDVLIITSNVAIIHVTGTVTNGQWIYNSTTGGFGISTGTPIVGTFAQALADKGVGAGVDADQVLAYIRPPAVMAGGGSEVHINYPAPATPFAQLSAMDIQIDASALAATSEVHGINIAVTGVPGAGEKISGLGIHGLVDPIHQHVGTFVTPSQTEYAARFPDGGAWADRLDGEPIVVGDDDVIYIGAVAVFSDLEVILSTPASQDEFLVFEYQHTDLSWDVFVPMDGTDGFRQSGIIDWDSAALTNWKSDSDPGGADGSAGYYVRVRRTRNNVVTDPVVTTIKTLEPDEYGWDKVGDLDTRDIDARNIAATGITTQDANTEIIDDGDPTKIMQFQVSGIAAGTTRTMTVPDADITLGTDADAIHDNVASEISAITEKGAPATGDWILIEDAADGNAKKRVNWSTLPGAGASGNDPSAIHDNIASEISAITEKASPVSADLIIIEDSEDSNNKKRVQIGNLPGLANILDVPAEYATIPLAIAAASAGDLILIQPGTYDASADGNITVNIANITLQGFGAATIIDGGTTGHAIGITAAGVTIRDLAVQTTAGATNSFIGIFSSGDRTTLLRVTVNQCDHIAFSTSGNDLRMLDCVVDGADAGAISASGNQFIIRGCITGTVGGGNAITLSGDGGSVTGNIFGNGSVRAISLTASASLIVVDSNYIVGGILDNGTDDVIGDNS